MIPNGAHIDLFKPMNIVKSKDDLRLYKKDDYVCLVCNLASWRGVEYLIKSANDLGETS